jgi:hypothetical protein
MKRTRVLLFGVVVLGAGCVSAQAELPEIEVTEPSISFPAYPVAADETTVTVSFPINAAKLGSSTKAENQQAISALQMHDILLVPTAGVSSLGFIRHLTVTASPASVSGPATLIVDYERPASDAQAELHAMPTAPVDLLPLWRPKSAAARTVHVALTVTGVLPSTTWAVEGRFILSATLHN